MARLPVDIMTAGDRSNLPSGQMQINRASAADFGGNIGNAISGLGDTVGRLGAKIAANAKRVQEFDYEKQYVDLQEQDNVAYEEKTRSLDGNADGHWVNSRKETEDRFNKWLANLPEASRAEYAPRVAAFRAQRTGQAFKDQYAQQDANVRVTLTEEQRKAGLQVQANPGSFDLFVRQQEDLIDKSPLTKLEKAQKKAELRNSLAFEAERSRATNDPAGYVGANMQDDTVSQQEQGLYPNYKSLIRAKEGFRSTPYWDVNHYRAGYGSDTVTRADGSVVKVTPGMKVSREDAERDLDRRIGKEFLPAARNAIGGAQFDKLSPAAKAVMASLSYNYGAGAWKENDLSQVIRAARSGDKNALAQSVANLGSHNGGANRGRREAEARMISSGVVAGKSAGEVRDSGAGIGVQTTSSGQYVTPDQNYALNELAQRKLAQDAADAKAQAAAAADAARNQVYIDLKEGANPETTYQQARKAGVLTDIDHIQKAETIMKERDKKDSDYNVGVDLMQNGAANPFSKDHKDGIDALYTQQVKSGADPAVVAGSIFNRTGMVAPKFGVALRGALASNDAEKYGAGVMTAANMLRSNPNAFAGVEGGNDLEKQAIRFKHLTEDMGMSSQQATQKLMDEARAPVLDPVKQEALLQFRKTALTQDTIDTRLKTKFSTWTSSVELPTGSQRTAMSSIYSEFAEEGYEKFRDPKQALSYADLQVEKQFGVQNGVLMRYPPDKSGLPKLPGADDGHAWVSEQATKTVKDELGIVVDPKQVLLVPVERFGVSTSAAYKGKPATVSRKDAGDPMQQTSFTSVPYQIMVMPATPEQDIVVMPGAFFPDIDTYVNDKNAEIKANPVKPQVVRGIKIPAAPAKMFTTPEGAQRAKDADLRLSREHKRAADKQFTDNIDAAVLAKQTAIDKLKGDLARARGGDPGEADYIDQQIQRLESEMYDLKYLDTLHRDR